VPVVDEERLVGGGLTPTAPPRAITHRKEAPATDDGDDPLSPRLPGYGEGFVGLGWGGRTRPSFASVMNGRGREGNATPAGLLAMRPLDCGVDLACQLLATSDLGTRADRRIGSSVEVSRLVSLSLFYANPRVGFGLENNFLWRALYYID
jgi:hypothetical protein